MFGLIPTVATHELAPGEVLLSPVVDLRRATRVHGIVRSDQPVTMVLEQLGSGASSWDEAHVTAVVVSAGVAAAFSIDVTGVMARLRFVNGDESVGVEYTLVMKLDRR